MKNLMQSFLKVGLLTILLVATSLETQAATPITYQVIDATSIRLIAPQNQVIRNRTDWQSFYLAATSWIYPQPAVPSIDFSKVVVAVMASGEKATGGYKLLISSLIDVPTSSSVATSYIDVQAALINPDIGCMVSQSATYPVAMFTIPRTAKPFVFRVGNVYNKCL